MKSNIKEKLLHFCGAWGSYLPSNLKNHKFTGQFSDIRKEILKLVRENNNKF